MSLLDVIYLCRSWWNGEADMMQGVLLTFQGEHETLRMQVTQLTKQLREARTALEVHSRHTWLL